MSEFHINIPAGQNRRLLTGGTYCPSDIQVTAQACVIEKDVNFYDYDGTLLHSYTVEEAQVLSALPPLPEHDGLVCQGWNWTLDAIRALTRPMTIGAMYITDDGATRLYISIPKNSRRTIPLYFSQTMQHGVMLDWGDGCTETLEGTGTVSTSHDYANHGDYTIRLIPQPGCEMLLGGNATGIGIFGAVTDTSSATHYLQNMLVRAELGSQISAVSTCAFYYCTSLSSITIPSGILGINADAFRHCAALYCVIIPSGLSNGIGQFAFFCNYALSILSFPHTTGNLISSSEFQGCSGLVTVDIPDAVAEIGWSTLRDCNSLRKINKSSSTKLLASCCRYCRSLVEAAIGHGASTIGTYQFDGCHSLSNVVITSPIQRIESLAFNNCYAMTEYDFTASTSVPTLENVNAFSNIPADCVIKVPAELYAEWVCATNWSVYADHILGV